jgi:hypothetical protein
VIDLCGICGGNNSACVGCDGQLYGLQYDICGICGGNGTSCFDPCPATSCEKCVEAHEGCYWCPTQNKCLLGGGDCENAADNCDPPLPITVIVGTSIGAGVIAAIAIAGVVFLVLGAISGKKGYDVYMRNQGPLNTANTNPLYNDNGRTGTNPFHGVSQVFKRSFRNLKEGLSSRNLRRDE